MTDEPRYYPPEFYRERARIYMREARSRGRDHPHWRDLVATAWRARLVAQRLEAEARGEHFPLMMWGDSTGPPPPTKKGGPK